MHYLSVLHRRLELVLHSSMSHDSFYIYHFLLPAWCFLFPIQNFAPSAMVFSYICTLRSPVHPYSFAQH
jgi:hypothetical protein